MKVRENLNFVKWRCLSCNHLQSRDISKETEECFIAKLKSRNVYSLEKNKYRNKLYFRMKGLGGLLIIAFKRTHFNTSFNSGILIEDFNRLGNFRTLVSCSRRHSLMPVI